MEVAGPLWLTLTEICGNCCENPTAPRGNNHNWSRATRFLCLVWASLWPLAIHLIVQLPPSPSVTTLLDLIPYFSTRYSRLHTSATTADHLVRTFYQVFAAATACYMALIRTQRSEYDLHFQLRVDNLRALFDVPLGMTAGTKIYSDRVGPGLYLYLRPALTPNKKYVCSLYLATTETKRTASLSLDVEVAVRSLRGVKYYTRAFRTVFEKSVESAMGWYEFMTVEQYENSQTMRWENAIVLEVTIRSFAPKTSIRNNAALDTLHKTLTSANLLDTVFLLFASRSRTGRLTRPRQFFVSKVHSRIVVNCRNVVL
ncbi:hypothetical protein B0H21DRAFT_414506 [Amylocystis lapponica]|nr:hypothetical protein B0H21DRAFT_414506 [Amylocystis lapponica]